VRLPRVSAKPGFRPLCKRLRLLALSAAEFGDGLWTVSNADRLGSSEVAQVDAVIKGVQQLVALEMRLDAGEEVNLDDVSVVADVKMPAADVKVPSRDASGPKAADIVPLQDLCNKAAMGSEQLGKFTKAVKKPDSKTSCSRAQRALEKGANDGRLASILRSMAVEVDASEEAAEEATPRASVAFSDIPGLGDAEVPGFPADECPAELPDLSRHHSIMANVLKKDPGIYIQLRGSRTTSGVGLAKCIKPGIDNPGHPMIKTVGAFAGDAECYGVFGDLFDKIIQGRHAGYSPAAGKIHLTDLDAGKVPVGVVDPTGKHVLSARVKASRNLQGVAFPTSISREDRMKVECLVTKAFSQLSGDLKGEYLPLKSAGQAGLEPHGLLFQQPDSALLLSSGVGRHWPDARGIFANPARSLAVWVNDEDHLRFFSTQPGDGLQQAFRRLCEGLDAVGGSLAAEGVAGGPAGYARSEGLGFLTSCPSKLGSGGLQASVLARLPLLGAQPDFKATCKRLGVQVRMIQTETWGSAWKISEVAQLGRSEVEMMGHFSSACRQLVEMEVGLERAGAASSS